jgi:regulator of RNase E activity RraA
MASFGPASRFAIPVTVGQLRIQPGDLLIADGDGCVRIPVDHAADVLRLARKIRARERAIFDFYEAPDFSVAQMRARQAE